MYAAGRKPDCNEGWSRRVTILDWILGRNKERARQEAEAKADITRQADREADQEHVRPSGQERASRQPEPANKPERRPGERMMPHEAERLREAHNRKPEPERVKEQEQEATRMAYTRTAQPPPSLGGAGKSFVNPRAQQPRRSIADEMLAEARAELAKEEAAMTPQQKLDRDRQQEVDRSNDTSRGREL